MRIIKNQWKKYLDELNIFTEQQFPLRKGRSCVMNLPSLYSGATDVLPERWMDELYTSRHEKSIGRSTTGASFMEMTNSESSEGKHHEVDGGISQADKQKLYYEKRNKSGSRLQVDWDLCWPQCFSIHK